MREKFCKVCLDQGASRPYLRIPGSSYCRDHLNEYHRTRRARMKAEREEFLKTHNDRGEPLNEWGMTEVEVQDQLDVLDNIERYQRPDDLD